MTTNNMTDRGYHIELVREHEHTASGKSIHVTSTDTVANIRRKVIQHVLCK